MARKILLADDSVTAQNMGRRILGDAGYDVVTVNNGSAALKKIAELKPDVIILDVYMPGYGGLEVCSRLKESPETSRIPVLITVGKMEPFKAEEANRVKADAYMVKPFETNELLTAIAKLEDKIVPEAEGQKKRTKASASDKPSGSCKPSRWSVPDDAAEKDSDIAGQKAETVKTKSAKSKYRNSDDDDPVPPDVEPKKDEKSVEFEVATTWADTSVDLNAIPAVTKLSDQPDETAPETSSAKLITNAAASVEVDQAPVTFASADSAHAEIHEEPESNRTYRDTEVVEALASLVPISSASQDYYPKEHVSAASSSPSEKSGPRWIAESVPLSQDEVGLMLESEMQKAHAASAAAEGAGTKPAVALESLHEDDSESSDSSVENNLTVSKEVVPEPWTPSPSQASSSEQSIEERAGNKWEQDSHAETAWQNSEAFHDSARLISAVSSVVEKRNVGDKNAERPEICAENRQDAFAAAASAGTDSASQTKSELGPDPGDEDRAAKSGMASAWENWNRIRETIVGPNLASDVAEAAALPVAGFKDLRREAKTTVASEEIVANTVKSQEASEISSIVDSMLAELKPKLMEEIARKMGKDFKKD